MEERPNADELSEALQDFHGDARPASRWWLRFAFHYTDIRNVVSILESGELYSRSRAEKEGVMDVDNASLSVISQSQQSHSWVRLYFRPKTPTQYINEGIKPEDEREDGHCPVPVFLFFGLECLIRKKEVEFSGRGLNKKYPVRTYSSPDVLRSDRMPAKDIYHHGPYNPSSNPEIKDRRHAEIVYPDALPLKPCLVGITCRSSAEKQTLLYLMGRSGLTDGEVGDYRDLIRIVSSGDLFYKNWPFVEEVSLKVDRSTGNSLLSFKFWPSSRSVVEYKYSVRIYSENTGKVYTGEGVYDHGDTGILNLRIDEEVRDVRINFTLDGELAYAGRRSVRQLYG